MDLSGEPQVVAVMRRLYLNAGDGTAGRLSDIDPRELPGLQLHADEFGIGQRQIGRLDAEILADPLGLRLVSFESATDSFTAQGSGGWFVGDEGDTTRFAVEHQLDERRPDAGAARLRAVRRGRNGRGHGQSLLAGPAVGRMARPHRAAISRCARGKGSLVDVEPGGAGRAAGLLSISALPRRLALDFRDVFNRGLVFDEITADFVIVDGNAYTDNLKLTGPVAEVGLIGRTGLRDHDYRQQAVVTAEPGKVLPTVGALLAGPQVAAALLIFTRIFKKPLGGIGRASYCVTGSWSEPTVERLTDEQLEEGAVCAELPPNGALPKPAGGRGAMKVAAVQMTSTRDVQANLREAGRLVADAARQGAKLVVLPENFSFLGATDADRVAAVERVRRRSRAAVPGRDGRELGIWIVGGTIPIRDRGDGGDRASSRSLLVGPDGRVAAHYDKIHLFDVDIPGARGRALQRIRDDARGHARRRGGDAARAHRHDGVLRHSLPGAVSPLERARHRHRRRAGRVHGADGRSSLAAAACKRARSSRSSTSSPRGSGASTRAGARLTVIR